MKKIVVKLPKPRNPLTVPALLRRAGSHRPGGRSMRQHAGQTLRRELSELTHSP